MDYSTVVVDRVDANVDADAGDDGDDDDGVDDNVAWGNSDDFAAAAVVAQTMLSQWTRMWHCRQHPLHHILE